MNTAQWVAAVRARESARPDRLFDDPYAHALAGPDGYSAMARSEHAAGGENRMIPVRVRWFDDAIGSAARDGVRHVVMLGPGSTPARTACRRAQTSTGTSWTGATCSRPRLRRYLLWRT